MLLARHLQRKSNRLKKQTEFYQAGESGSGKKSGNKSVNFALVNCETLNENDEPNTFKEALNSIHKVEWKMAIDSELDSLNDNKTWFVSTLPPG